MCSNVIHLKGGRFQVVCPRAHITLATPLAAASPNQCTLTFNPIYLNFNYSFLTCQNAAF